MRKLFSLTLLFLLASTAFAQDWAKAILEKSPRHHEWVTLKASDGKPTHAFVVYPEKKGKATVVIVIHENAGLTDWARTVADQLAESGYIAITPDLLTGMAPSKNPDGTIATDKTVADSKTSDFPDGDSARQAIRKLTPEYVTAALNAAVDYGKKIPAGNGKVVVSGFCWGGGQTFRFATANQEIKAAFPFYGPSPAPEAVTTIKAPVYAFYAGNDERINASIPATKEAMEKAGKKYDYVIYEGSGHGYMRAGLAPLPPDANEEAKTRYEANKKARAESWKRWLELLKKI